MRSAVVAAAAALLGIGAPVLLAATSGREVLAEAQGRNGFSTWRDRKSVVTLEGFDGENHTTREAEVWERTDPHGEHREVFAYRSPGELAGTRYLVVSPRHARQDWWMWTPVTRRARKLGGTYPGLQRDEIFFMTDLSYSDLVLVVRIQQWTDAEGDVRLEGEGPCGEKTCDRLRLVPAADNGEFPCASYRLWFTRDDRLLVRAELYDPDGALMKTIACRGYFATGRFMTPRTCEIEHQKTKTRSVVTVNEVAYDIDLPDDAFSVAHFSDAQ